MCTKVTKKLDSNKVYYGWKVVKRYDNWVRSYYQKFNWVSGKVLKAELNSYNSNNVWIYGGFFHCYSTRKEARSFIKYIRANHIGPITKEKVKIIKVKLSGKLYKGETEWGDANIICSTKAYWDGQFHS